MKDAYTFLKEILDTPERIAKRKAMHPYCQECLYATNPKNYIGSQPERRSRETTKERGDPECVGIYLKEDFEYGYTELQKAGYVQVTLDDVVDWLNPSHWVQKNLSLTGTEFKPYWYQDRTLKCTARLKALRKGRRAGKTEFIAAYAVYRLFNPPKPFWKILITCPQQPHSKEIYEKINEFLTANPALIDSVIIKKTPYFELKVKGTRARLRIFTAGSKSGNKALGVRGQGANEIVLDETDYLSEDDTNTISPILTDPGGGMLLAASTLNGQENTFFYKLCHMTSVKEFYIPFRARPDWTPEKEQLARDTCANELTWELEYNVRWVGQVAGVFQKQFVGIAFNRHPYTYEDMKFNPGWKYYLGIDWNGDNNGTRLVVVGFDPGKKILYTVAKEIVAYEGWTQTKAISKIIELNRIWKPDLIVIDRGFGQCQDEIIRLVGIEADKAVHMNKDLGDSIKSDARLKDIVEVVDFGGTIVIPNLFTKTDEQKYAKQYLVENLQRLFELQAINLAEDDTLKHQLLNYVVGKFGTKGPVYKAGKEGDHDLDALALACFGFAKKCHYEFQESDSVIAAVVVKKSAEQLQAESEEQPQSLAILHEEQKYNKHNDPPQVAIMPKFKNKPKESRAITKNNKINKVPSRGINKDTNNIIGFMRGRHGQN